MKRFTQTGIVFALIFMIAELSYINAKSLLYLADNTQYIDHIFAIVGSLAFSMVTILVMRNSVLKWVKFVFPAFDSALVFCGFNLTHASDILSGSDNPVRFWLTVFMALFTGLITYSLGIINYKGEDIKEQRLSDKYKQLFNESGRKLDELRAKLQQSHVELQQKEKFIDDTTTAFNQQAVELDETKSALQQINTELQQRNKYVLQLHNELEQYKIACTCPYCNEIFESEAAMRSHKGRCNKKSKAA